MWTVVDLRKIEIPEDRQRALRSSDEVKEFALTLEEEGLINPITLRMEDGQRVLVAGEGRIGAANYLGLQGKGIKFGKKELAPFYVPYVDVGAITELQAAQLEYSENMSRKDLTWQERDAAVQKIADLRGTLGMDVSTKAVAEDMLNILDLGNSTEKDAPTATDMKFVRDAQSRQRYMDDPAVAKARTAKEADKIIEKRQKEEQAARLAEEFKELDVEHELIEGDCLEVVPRFADKTFDIILSDPIYGINAHEQNSFQRVNYKAEGKHHTYDDSEENFDMMFSVMPDELYRVAKPDAHLFLFCDIGRFYELAEVFSRAGWNVWKRPIIWYKGNIGSLPEPKHGPRYTYEAVLFARKGGREINKVFHDVITTPQTTGHFHPAGKPSAVYHELLKRVARAGDTVLDFNSGAGPILPAANDCNCIATTIELDPKYAAHQHTRKRSTVEEDGA